MKGIICIILVLLCSVFLGCGEAESGTEYGKLTITNLPSVPSYNYFGSQVYWIGGVYYADKEIKSDSELDGWIEDSGAVNDAADFQNPDGTFSHTSPFNLEESDNPGEGFLESGRFLVVVEPSAAYPPSPNYEEYSQYRAYMYVSFINGNATIDYDEMSRRDDLPY